MLNKTKALPISKNKTNTKKLSAFSKGTLTKT